MVVTDDAGRLAAWRGQVVGLDREVPLLDGSQSRHVELDNAATTPALESVMRAVSEFLPGYASVHRGSGFKARLSTAIYEQTRAVVADFVGARPGERVVVYTKNATEALNKLAARLPLAPDDVVLCSVAEHHSNLLPWRSRAIVDHCDIEPSGDLDLADMELKLRRHRGRVRVVAVTGGSNVTGCIPPIHRIAALAHEHGAEIVVDAAQLAPHRPIAMRDLADPERLDYLVFSAHKMYAPFGAGVLVGPRALFDAGAPDQVGGGTVRLVTLDEAVWSDPPEKEEAGSPNAVGAVALAAAIRSLQALGLEAIAAHERHLTVRALARLAQIPGVRLYGLPDLAAGDRLGVITFNVGDVPCNLVAAILGWEFGIATRSGCFCAHPYLMRLLNVSEADADCIRRDIIRGVRAGMPGAVRASFGFYNTPADVDALASAIDRIARGQVWGRYRQDPTTGEYAPTSAPEACRRFAPPWA